MLLIHGRRTARIKNFTDYTHQCRSCKSFDLNVKLYRSYYHLFWVPLFPVGEKTCTVRCNQCGEPMRLEAAKTKYIVQTRTPFYLYTLPILFTLLVIFILVVNTNTQRKKARYVENPMVGDVITIREDVNSKATYYFFKVAEVGNDTIKLYPNVKRYLNFVTGPQGDDDFDSINQQIFTKKELKDMLDNGSINDIERTVQSN